MPEKRRLYINITFGTIFKFFGVLLLIWAVFLVRDVVMALIFAVIVASAIEPAIEWLKARKVPRILSAVLIYLGLVSLFVFAVYLFVPVFLTEMRAAADTFPAIREKFTFDLGETGDRFFSYFGEDVPNFFQVPEGFIKQLGGGILNAASAVFGGILSAVLVVVFSFYIAAQEKGIEGFLRILAPVAQEAYVVDLWQRSQRKLGIWLRSQLLLGAIVGVLIFFGLSLLKVPNAFLFGFLAAVFEIIPVVGPLLAAVPAVATALLSSPFLGVLTIALYVVVQQIESHIIVPVVIRKAIGLSPLVVVLALIIGAKLGGIFGILLAVPLTAVLSEFLEDFDRKKRAFPGSL